MRVGYEWVHSLVDDHSRLAYSELHRDERAATVTGFVERGLAFYAAHGIEPKRLLTDNAFVYRHNRSLRELLAEHGDPPPASSAPPPQANGRSSATSRPSSANGRSARSTARATTAPSPVTLAALLQRAQTTQLARRPATDQPRPQRPEAGHLGADRLPKRRVALILAGPLEELHDVAVRVAHEYLGHPVAARHRATNQHDPVVIEACARGLEVFYLDRNVGREAHLHARTRIRGARMARRVVLHDQVELILRTDGEPRACEDEVRRPRHLVEAERPTVEAP